MAAVKLGDDQEVDVTLVPKDAQGQPTTLDGPVAWESADPAIATVTGADLSATIVAQAIGNTQVKGTGDADPSSGVRPIVAVIDVTVAAGEAQSFDVSIGMPRPKAAPQP